MKRIGLVVSLVATLLASAAWADGAGKAITPSEMQLTATRIDM